MRGFYMKTLLYIAFMFPLFLAAQLDSIDIYIAQGNYLRAAELAKKLTDNGYSSTGYRNLGNAYAAAEDFESAKYFYGVSLERSPSPKTLNNLGLVHWQQGNLDSAKKYIQEAANTHSDPMSITQCYNNLALINIDMAEYDSALVQLLACKVFFDPSTTAYKKVLANIGLVLLEQKMYDESIEASYAALANLDTVNNQHTYKNVLYNLFAAYAGTGRIDLASVYQAKWTAIIEEVAGSEVQIAMAKNKANVLLNEAYATIGARTEQRNLILMGSVLILILLLIGASLILYVSRIKHYTQMRAAFDLQKRVVDDFASIMINDVSESMTTLKLKLHLIEKTGNTDGISDVIDTSSNIITQIKKATSLYTDIDVDVLRLTYALSIIDEEFHELNTSKKVAFQYENLNAVNEIRYEREIYGIVLVFLNEFKANNSEGVIRLSNATKGVDLTLAPLISPKFELFLKSRIKMIGGKLTFNESSYCIQV